MKKMFLALQLGALCFIAPRSAAQEKSQEKAKSEERAKPPIPVRVQVVFNEYDGDKKVSSMPYSFIVTDEKVGLRTGVRIPIETDGKDQKTTYLDVGSNIDCSVRTEDDARFRVYLVFERSSIYPGGSSGDERLAVTRPNNQPLIRQFRTSENLLLKDGQTSESVVSTDPLNGHSMRITVTINSLK